MSFWDNLPSGSDATTPGTGQNDDCNCTPAWAVAGVSLGAAAAGVGYGLYQRYAGRREDKDSKDQESRSGPKLVHEGIGWTAPFGGARETDSGYLEPRSLFQPRDSSSAPGLPQSTRGLDQKKQQKKQFF